MALLDCENDLQFFQVAHETPIVLAQGGGNPCVSGATLRRSRLAEGHTSNGNSSKSRFRLALALTFTVINWKKY